MPFKRKNTTTKTSNEGKSFLGLLPCFRCPRVDEPENNLQASSIADHRNKLKLPCLPWPKIKRKKKKMKKTIPFDLQCATSSLSFIPSSHSNNSTTKGRNGRGWCKRKHKAPTETLSDQGTTHSCTASVESMDRIAPSQPGPSIASAQPQKQTDRSGLPQNAVNASNHIIGRIGGRRLRLGAGLWVMVTSLGVMVVFGRSGAVLFLSSCWYFVPMVLDAMLSRERHSS